MHDHATQYAPDSVTPPGVFLQEKLEEIGMSQSELAARIGRTKKMVNELISSKAPLEPETALRLERVLAIPASFWSNAERNYRDSLLRLVQRTELVGSEHHLKRYPISAMRKLGWLPQRNNPIDCLIDLLNYFGAASFDLLDQLASRQLAAFRQSAAFRVDPYATLAWLRQGELRAHSISCQPYSKDEFIAALTATRRLTLRPLPEVFPEVASVCAAAGVAVVAVKAIPGSRAHGATRWLSPTKALIQCSVRGRTADQFWFTFFHEAGHILLHGKKDIFVESPETQGSYEDEANRFAAESLIPAGHWHVIKAANPRSAVDIELLARQLDVAPGIIVGRLQREGLLPYSHHRRLMESVSPESRHSSIQSA